MTPIKNPISVSSCYATARKAFKKWWIPLCLISGLLFVFHWAPRLMLHPEKSAMIQTCGKILPAMLGNDLNTLSNLITDLSQQLTAYSIKLSKYAMLIFPLAALATILLLMTANTAVRNQRQKQRPLRLIYIAITNIVLSGITSVAFLFFIIPGCLLYIRLLFVSLIMLEDEDKNPIEAVQESWNMTEKSFWPLCGLMVTNTILQALSMITIIGLIPATGFANTARAAAFQLLRHAPSAQSPCDQNSNPS